MDKLKMPSDAELMKIAIDDLNNSSISLEDRLRALDELLILVEPIDNANGMQLPHPLSKYNFVSLGKDQYLIGIFLVFNC